MLYLFTFDRYFKLFKILQRLLFCYQFVHQHTKANMTKRSKTSNVIINCLFKKMKGQYKEDKMARRIQNVEDILIFCDTLMGYNGLKWNIYFLCH
jgi:hypothetical protein